MLEKVYRVFNWIIIISISLLTVGSLFFQNYYEKKEDNDNKEVIKEIDQKLESKGYSKQEVSFIEKNKKLYQVLLNKKYDKNIVPLTKEKYFILDNLDRYLTYLEQHKDKSINETITLVNVNRDYDYYTNIKNTDINKKELMLVNKYYKLDENFIPENLVNINSSFIMVKEAYDEFVKMKKDAQNIGLTLIVNSSYRDYDHQSVLWNRYKNRNGINWADSVSARPGQSEHQTGYTMDLGTPTASLDDFEFTKEFNWVRENCHKYGFIMRYPKGKDNITGYSYEPWHYRFIGIEAATKLKKLDITFDEYYAYYVF